MSIANRLYDRPHGSNISPVNVPMLYVSGTLPDAAVGVAYRGTLDIHNAIGACRVTLISGDLPPGYTLGVDNTAHQIVLTWPAYQSGTAAIANANFAAGDDGSWETGAGGWSIMQGVTAPDPADPGNTWQAQFANAGGESMMMHRMWAQVTPGQSITASCNVQQGASSANSAGAAVRLQFKDAAGVVTNVDGNVVKSGSNSEWHPSTLSTSAPVGAVAVRIGAAAYRKRENKPLWVDTFAWDVVMPTQGIGSSETIPLTLRVIDAAGRAATWSGVIDVIVSKFVIVNEQTEFVTDVYTTTDFAAYDGPFSVTPPFADATYRVADTGDAILNFQSGQLAVPRVPDGPLTSTSAPVGEGMLRARTFPEGMIILTGGASAQHYYSSTNKGRTWVRHDTVGWDGPKEIVRLIKPDGSIRWVCGYQAGPSTTIAYSDDAFPPVHWTVTNNATVSTFIGDAWACDGKTICYPDYGGVYRSTDGVTWAVINTGTSSNCRAALALGNDVFVLPTISEGILRSGDGGHTWTRPTTTSPVVYDRAAMGAGVAVVGSTAPAGWLLSADAGLTWGALPAQPPVPTGSRGGCALVFMDV